MDDWLRKIKSISIIHNGGKSDLQTRKERKRNREMEREGERSKGRQIFLHPFKEEKKHFETAKISPYPPKETSCSSGKSLTHTHISFFVDWDSPFLLSAELCRCLAVCVCLAGCVESNTSWVRRPDVAFCRLSQLVIQVESWSPLGLCVCFITYHFFQVCLGVFT